MPVLLGFDIGSSFIKASLIDADSGSVLAFASSPETELAIHSPEPGYAEQEPMLWWENVIAAAKKISSQGFDLSEVVAVGISYQMHGLVLVDKEKRVLRPAIIWCDSRAVETGSFIAQKAGIDKCYSCLRNHPGNFTSARLLWVKQREPDLFRQINKAMLPGEFIGMMLTGKIVTTRQGLSEGMFLDFQTGGFCHLIYEELGITEDLLPEPVPTFGYQGEVTSEAAEATGIKPGTPVTYRSGDQPNNAFSLGVLNPGEVAATAGTSGVIFAVTCENLQDLYSRYNVFSHVNDQPDSPHYGILLCINGTGALYRWLKNELCRVNDKSLSYSEMNEIAAGVPVGSDGLVVLPFGNGAERVLANRNPGASIHGLSFGIHHRGHLIRASQEGIVFALNYGAEILKSEGIQINLVRAGNSNMFLSELFCQAFANTINATLELYNTDGSQGAARGAGIGAGIYTFDNAFRGIEKIKVIHPDDINTSQYKSAYMNWLDVLNREIINA